MPLAIAFVAASAIAHVSASMPTSSRQPFASAKPSAPPPQYKSKTFSRWCRPVQWPLIEGRWAVSWAGSLQYHSQRFLRAFVSSDAYNARRGQSMQHARTGSIPAPAITIAVSASAADGLVCKKAVGPTCKRRPPTCSMRSPPPHTTAGAAPGPLPVHALRLQCGPLGWSTNFYSLVLEACKVPRVSYCSF